MKSNRHDFTLGLFVIAATVLLVGSILFIYPRLPSDTRPITVRFAHDDGLAPIKPASPVMLGGAVEIGKVRSVGREIVTQRTAAGEHPRLMITVVADIASDIELYRDCRITTDQPPVGGPGVLVVLSVGRPDAGRVGAEPIDGLPAQSLAASIGSLSRFLFEPGGFLEKLDRTIDAGAEGSLMNKLVASLEDVNAITTELRAQFRSGDQMALLGKVQQMADNLNSATAALRDQLDATDRATLMARLLAAMDHLSLALGDVHEILQENRPALRRTMESLDTMSAALEQRLVAALQAEFNREDPASLLGKIHGSMDRLNASLDNVSSMTDAGRSLMLLNRPAIDETIRYVNEMSAQLKLAADELRVAPWRLLWKPGNDQSKEMTIFAAARNFAEAAQSLDGAAARLQSMHEAAAREGRPVATAEEVEEMRAALNLAFERFRKAEDFLFERLR